MSFYRNAKKLTPLLKFLCNVHSEGAENMPAQGPVILCANHRSNIDPVLLGIVLDRSLFFMAKVSLFKVPILNKLIRALGAFPVNRGVGDRDAINKAISIVKNGDVLAMFPEGHRQKKDGEPQRFQSGAARIANQTEALILPAAIICKGRVGLFNRKLVKIGKPMTASELGFTDGGHENMRIVSENIRLVVKALLEG
jgi:1-acyl-sn-glycerol-3-phosphate acyltransferase